MAKHVWIKKDHLCVAAAVVILVLGLWAAVGFSGSTGAVVKSCHNNANGNWDFCSEDCKCSLYQGDCDSSNECEIGMKCTDNFGPVVGLDSWVDVCVDYATYLDYKKSITPEPQVYVLS